MTAPGHSLLRPWLAGLLVFVLLIAGVGRGWAVPSGIPDAAPRIAGIVVPICHAADSGDDGHASTHDCCDACALCAPAALPNAPVWPTPAFVARVATHGFAIVGAPTLARCRTPRWAQGPPRLT